MKEKLEAAGEIAEVHEMDSERIWAIRNHPLARKNSVNPEIISLESHKEWFHKKYFEGQDNHCFILKENGIVLGYCRFDYDEDTKAYIISIAVDPEKHGKGLGSRLLSQSLSELEKKIKASGSVQIMAEVKKNNIASVKLFERNRFKKYKEDEENNYYQMQYAKKI